MQQVMEWQQSLDRIDNSSSTDNFAYLPSGVHTIQIPQPVLQTAITPKVRSVLIVGVIGACILALKYKGSSALIDEEETVNQTQRKNTPKIYDYDIYHPSNDNNQNDGSHFWHQNTPEQLRPTKPLPTRPLGNDIPSIRYESMVKESAEAKRNKNKL